MKSADDFAVVIGISQYRRLDPDIPNLAAASSDAKAMATWLRDSSGGGFPAVTLLTDDAATHKNAILAFRKILGQVQQGELPRARRLYIYMSGYGYRSDTNEVAVLMADASPELLAYSAIGAKAYADFFRDSGAFEEIVLFVDSAAITEFSSTKGPPEKGPEPSPPLFSFPSMLSGHALPQTASFYAFSGASDERVRQAEPSSFFTHALLEGLSGGAAGPDGFVDSELLKNYIIHRVPDPGSQMPEFLSRGKPIVFSPFAGAESTDAPIEEALGDSASEAESATTSPVTIDLALFSSISRRALGWADAFRLKLEQRHVHTEHLIAAVYQSGDKRVLDVFHKAEVDWPKLLSVLHESESKIPAAAEKIQVEADEATALPVLTNHARTAIERGVALARSENNSVVLPRHLLFGALSIQHAAEFNLRERGLQPELLKRKSDRMPPGIRAPRGRTNAGQDIPGVSSDVAKGDDLLDIKREVAALCSVIAARDVHPPLSIGLFGDWGTGKSFFMDKMWDQIVDLKIEGQREGSPFCSQIVQLKFNAWYYIDTNLWATLGSEIFRGLADELAKDKKQPAQARERLLAAAASQRDVVAEAEHRASVASEQLHQSEERLTRLASDEAAIDARLRKPSVILRAAYRVAVQDPDVQAKVREAALALNIPSVEAAATETKARLMELHGLAGVAQAMWLIACRHKGITALWILSGAVIIAILYALPVTVSWAKQIGLDSAIARLAALVTAAGVALRPLAKKARKALTFIRDARKKSQDVVDEEKRKKAEELRAQKEKIQEEAVGLQKRADDARAELAKREQQLQELRADRQMSDFIKSRNESRDYTSHLGVIARARDDFKRLSDLLEEVQAQAEAEKKAQAEAEKKGHPTAEKKGQPTAEKLLLPRIERIILYIDDLDRCPEGKVVDVLQAVHLLLAFPLFVVVVGVDSRWLLHSLKQHSRAFQPERNGDADELDEEGLHWESTPLNYLEKIFQIPFSLRPMQSDGFGDLIAKLTEPKEHPPDETESASESAGKPPVDPKQMHPVTVAQAGSGAPGQEAQPQVNLALSPTPEPAANTGPLPLQTGEQAVTDKKPPGFKPLNLSYDEREFMKSLYPLIPTPRTAKRFVNVYRLLRALSDDDEAFRGSKERAEHRAVLVLLAILTGYPSQGAEFLSDLLDGEATGRSWWEFVEGYRSRAKPKSDLASSAASHSEAERWRQFFEKIDEVRNEVREAGSCLDFDESCDAFVKWAGEVARFSFQSARVVLQRTGEELPTPRQGEVKSEIK